VIIGFTGTRSGMTDPQYVEVTKQLMKLHPDTLLNGGAVGADEQLICWIVANRTTLDTASSVKVEIYPASVSRERYWNRYLHQRLIETIWRVQEPLTRNRAIAEQCDRLIAAPASYREELRSGTWATVRYAKKAEKPVTVIFPDGSFYPFYQ
jgi:predicted Rossmann fold nucleotide-binding protein DprA/Smf involved in DNA uptake